MRDVRRRWHTRSCAAVAQRWSRCTRVATATTEVIETCLLAEKRTCCEPTVTYSRNSSLCGDVRARMVPAPGYHDVTGRATQPHCTSTTHCGRVAHKTSKGSYHTQMHCELPAMCSLADTNMHASQPGRVCASQHRQQQQRAIARALTTSTHTAVPGGACAPQHSMRPAVHARRTRYLRVDRVRVDKVEYDRALLRAVRPCPTSIASRSKSSRSCNSSSRRCLRSRSSCMSADDTLRPVDREDPRDDPVALLTFENCDADVRAVLRSPRANDRAEPGTLERDDGRPPPAPAPAPPPPARPPPRCDALPRAEGLGGLAAPARDPARDPPRDPFPNRVNGNSSLTRFLSLMIFLPIEASWYRADGGSQMRSFVYLGGWVRILKTMSSSFSKASWKKR